MESNLFDLNLFESSLKLKIAKIRRIFLKKSFRVSEILKVY